MFLHESDLVGNVRAVIYDGKEHPVDSKEIAFVQAGKKAFLDAVANARPIIMEPIVDVAITVPSDCAGGVAGDLSSMRGMINGTETLPDNRIVVSGKAPLKEIQGYHSRLKSLSGGDGSLDGIGWQYAIRVTLFHQLDHGKQHDITEVLTLELAGQVGLVTGAVDAGAKLRLPGLLLGAFVQQRQIGRGKGRSTAGLHQSPEHGTGHAQLQTGKRNEIAQRLWRKHVVASVDGARRCPAVLHIHVPVAGDPCGVFAVEEMLQTPGKP